MTLEEKLCPEPESVSAEREAPMGDEIPESKGLTWVDTFFDGKKGIVAVFDVDPEQVTRQKLLEHLLSRQLAAAYKDHLSDGKDHHVAITTEGIRVDPNPSISVTTKFSSIESCELASSGEIHFESTSRREVGRLVSLKNPLYGVLRSEECVNLVQAMKKRHSELTVNDVFPASASSMLRKSDYREIPETQPVTWKDPFYDGNDTIIAVFDRDKNAVRRGSVAENVAPITIFFLLYNGLFWAIIPDPRFTWVMSGFFFLAWLWFARRSYFKYSHKLGDDQHVAVTREGIRLDHGPHYFVTLPYDSFSTCEAVPYDNIFGSLVSPGLKQITLGEHPIDTMVAPGLEQITSLEPHIRETVVPQVDGLHYLLIGIEQAQEFADLVMAMKREQVDATSIDNPGGYEGVSTPESAHLIF